MPTFEIHGPDGQVYELGAPEGASMEQVQAMAKRVVIRAQAASTMHQGEGDAASGGTDWQNFAAGMGKAPVDLGRGIGQLLGLTSQEDVDEAKARDASLMNTKAGLFGNVAGNVAQSAVGGLAARGVAGAAGIANAARTAKGADSVARALIAPEGYKAAAATGAGLAALQPVASDDWGRAANAAGGAIAGTLGQALPRVAGATARGVKALFDPLTEGGQEKIAARTLARFAADPGAIAKAEASAIPGAQRTLAEATLDPGLAQLERGLQNSDATFANMLAGQRANSNQARLGALGEIAGDESKMEDAILARAKAAFPDLAKAKRAVGVETQRVVGLVDRILESPSGKRDAVESALSSVRSKLMNGDEPVADVASLYGVRKHIDDLLSGRLAGDSAQAKLASRELLTVKSALDHQIGKVAPEFKQYLAAYREGSAPINQMQIGQEILRRATGSTDDMLQNPVLSPAKFGQAMKSGDAVAQSATGFKRAELEKIMSPEQMGTFGAVRDDLMRQNVAQTAARAPGSPTAQNLAAQNVIRQTLGPLGVPDALMDHPMITPLVRALGSVYKIAGNDPEKLREALLNPQTAQKIMYYLPPKDRPQIEALIAAYGGVPLATALERTGSVQE